MPEHDSFDLDAAFGRLEQDIAGISAPRGAGAAITTARRRRQTRWGVAAVAALVVAGSAVGLHGRTGSDVEPPPTRPIPAPAVRQSFTSTTYGYTLKVPAGWTAAQASERWDGRTVLLSESPEVDRFTGTTTANSFAVARSWRRGLAAYVTSLVAWQARTHPYCPSKPALEKPVAIGGSPGLLLEYNCDVLINIAVTVKDGVAYWFLFDPGNEPALDGSDHVAFLRMLRSVEFPR
ncbi:MAG TPA: hypothetical protein VGK78_07565 [Nocardioides sp.]|uniref:hypothetical protein n=1 Tax=Nocardioides sp. TaxID=35761 RepID=UPI002F407880